MEPTDTKNLRPPTLRPLPASNYFRITVQKLPITHAHAMPCTHPFLLPIVKYPNIYIFISPFIYTFTHLLPVCLLSSTNCSSSVLYIRRHFRFIEPRLHYSVSPVPENEKREIELPLVVQELRRNAVEPLGR